MKKVFFTIAGMNHYYGTEVLKSGKKVKLIKEPDNEYDTEAIRVERKGLGKIGYVANSTHTVLGDSYSAGRIYGEFGKKAKGIVRYISPKGVICEMIEK